MDDKLYFKKYYEENKDIIKKRTTYWQKNNKDKRHKYSSEYRKGKKAKVFNLLGNKCIICGYSGTALQLDHINGNGNAERKKFSGNFLYHSQLFNAISNGSKKYQLLCANCNWEKRVKNKEWKKYV